MDFLTPELISTIATAVIGIAGAIFGSKYKDMEKGLKDIVQAAEDGKVTAEEVQNIALLIKKIKE